MLCADTTSIQYPECIGLDGEPLYAQKWLDVESSAQLVRTKVQTEAPDEVWVAGSDDVDAINLAAALKHDGASSKICLISFQENGSLLSRAQAAQIDEVWNRQLFLSKYHSAKEERNKALVPEVIKIDDVTTSVTPNDPDKLQNPDNADNSDTSDDINQRARHAAKPQVQAVQTQERGYLLSIVGAGGGVGKSSIAVVAAYLAQSKGYKTVLLDADLQFGDIQYLTGKENAPSVDEVIEIPGRLEALACDGRHPAILAAPKHLEKSEVLFAQVPGLIDQLRQRFDVVVVNTSPTWDDLHLRLLEAGGNALFIIDQRPSSIRSCRHALQLCSRCGVATQPIVFAINRCSRQSLFSSIDVTCALKGAHVVELADGGRDVEELLGTGAPIELIDSGNALCQSVARVLADLLPAQANPQAQIQLVPSRKRLRFGSKRKKAACL